MKVIKDFSSSTKNIILKRSKIKRDRQITQSIKEILQLQLILKTDIKECLKMDMKANIVLLDLSRHRNSR